MIGGATTRPLPNSTGPGTPTPTPHTGTGPSLSASTSSNSPLIELSTLSGPAATSTSSRRWASRLPARSASATSTPVAPRSAASTRPASGQKRTLRGARPPVETPRSPADTSPSSCRSAIRCVTSVRPRPVRATMSARADSPCRRTSSSTATSVSRWPSYAPVLEGARACRRCADNFELGTASGYRTQKRDPPGGPSVARRQKGLVLRRHVAQALDSDHNIHRTGSAVGLWKPRSGGSTPSLSRHRSGDFAATSCDSEGPPSHGLASVEQAHERSGVPAVRVVVVPPLVRRGLRVALGGVLPLLLAAERRDVEVAPGGAEMLVAAGIDEVGAEDPVAVADEDVVPVPLVHAEVLVEIVRDRVPGDELPPHARLQALDLGLRGARDVCERRVARVQVRRVCDLVGDHGAADASPLRVLAVRRDGGDVGGVEGPVDDQLPAALEEVRQGRRAAGSLESVFVLDRHPRHPATLGGQGVAGTRQLLLSDEQLLARCLPLLRGDDRRRLHGGMSSFR